MSKLTLQLWNPKSTWQDVATVEFVKPAVVRMEYDIDHAVENLGQKGIKALSLSFPVTLEPYEGQVPGFFLDLIPQGEPIKRLLARYRIDHENNYEQILTKVPLASPGNIRVKEAWAETELQKKEYDHPGFTLQDLVKYNTGFVSYMEQHGAPIGGTSGAGGGSPKFLLRQDHNLNFHADGLLDDAKTMRCLLVKFPFTDSQNSAQIAQTEKAYYDIARKLPIVTGAEIQIVDNILLIERFDRYKIGDKKFLLFGLESFYSAHNISSHGASLSHEDNIMLIMQHSTSPQDDVIEYLKRDILNRLFANTDNHGRNTSFLKTDKGIRLSPLYDFTAMRFFKADFIIPLTRWSLENASLIAQINWVTLNTGIKKAAILKAFSELSRKTRSLSKELVQHRVPSDFVEASNQDRKTLLRELDDAK